MIHQNIAPHEVFALHNLLTFKNICATKSATMSALASDSELRSLMEQDFSAAQGHIKELKDLMQQSNLADMGL